MQSTEESTTLMTVGGEIGETDRPMQTCCPLCRSRRLHYAFSIPGPKTAENAAQGDGLRVVRCDECRFMLLNPQPSDAELRSIYSADYFLSDEQGHAERMKSSTARGYLEMLSRYRGSTGGRLLEVGCGQGEGMVEAAAAGYEIVGVEISQSSADVARDRLAMASGRSGATASGTVHCSTLEEVDLAEASFDVCILADVIEHARDPLAMLRRIRTLLKPDGVLLIATPSLDSWSAKLMKRSWMEFKPEHLSYFDRNTLQNMLFLAGFSDTIVTPGYKTLNLDYVAGHFEKFPVPMFSRLVRTTSRLLPRRLRRRDVRVVASGMVAMTRVNPAAGEQPIRKQHTLSIVIPAFNESATVGPLLDAVLKKQIPNLAIEVIVVESNSTDGTRQIVEEYAGHPRVTAIFEDKPRGKGHAVRTGLNAAQGDFVLIQDADLEYDLEDYDVLLEPLITGREAIVLGSRHGGDAWWKMRQFERQPITSAFLNFGHWVFTTLVNVLFRQKLRDPFTMYKVFRRDCLAGLEFYCNRFDFDYELLIKLIRKGYKPIEIPVNYRSRSFKEGKKVSTFRDPINWLRALAWLRVTRIDPLGVVARSARPTIATTASLGSDDASLRNAA
ncbi:glycosyltransferase [Humisphaera borealis]|uniref:Glycosyltransferase n=1 Tax=Humisphaera borealis TaxID=2807512 RepID=A0A7M2WSU0_9BACT|nr:glycosyltransferase [Humisphaera borealis]QOV87881.1 glycosyltransferase [Humisphaera borealis]